MGIRLWKKGYTMEFEFYSYRFGKPIEQDYIGLEFVQQRDGSIFEFKNNDESVYVPKITFQKDMEQLEGMIQGAEESGDNLARLYQDEYNGLVKQHSEMKRLESIIYNLKKEPENGGWIKF